MLNTEPIYLDNNATTKCDPRVVEHILPYFTETYANPGSPHLAALAVKEAVENAIWHVASLIGAKESEIIFTSGATEAINLAIKGFRNSERKKIITCTTEHKAVLDTCRYMETQGFEVDYISVGTDGLIDTDLLEKSLSSDTLLVAVMMVNNETGTVQGIKKIADLVHSFGAYLLCDTTQAIGKIPVDVNELGIDFLAVSGHKFYGPKGIGALYISKRLKMVLQEQIHGGGQQRSLRSGTLNVPGIIGLGKACEIAEKEMTLDAERIGKLRDMLEYQLLKIDGSFINGSIDHRIYNTSNICFPGVFSEKLIISLGNISVSSGSACSSVTAEPSHVLKAMGLADADALCSIRFSLGRFTTPDDINTTISKVTDLVGKLRA